MNSEGYERREDVDVDVDVECDDPESTHPSGLPLHGFYSSLINRDGQNNIKKL